MQARRGERWGENASKVGRECKQGEERMQARWGENESNMRRERKYTTTAQDMRNKYIAQLSTALHSSGEEAHST
jgi:hypothetical protein